MNYLERVPNMNLFANALMQSAFDSFPMVFKGRENSAVAVKHAPADLKRKWLHKCLCKGLTFSSEAVWLCVWCHDVMYGFMMLSTLNNSVLKNKAESNGGIEGGVKRLLNARFSNTSKTSRREERCVYLRTNKDFPNKELDHWGKSGKKSPMK
ncbi:hypothetical protein CDAR_372551 [Caerostris darwini]|uniref:Uncharacterized protein n=1 Tax=Caerostris darwini TaxID=1538125 RepID=A0AAV4T957_9ARAC|nr:hypothetical protein CDAR_372551 [Caerostris darwini]